VIRSRSLPDWKIILDPSVKFRQLKSIYVHDENDVQPLEVPARWWDNPDKKELFLYNPKNHFFKPLDKMQNVYVEINYSEDIVKINEWGDAVD
jgi:hypothetical protein